MRHRKKRALSLLVALLLAAAPAASAAEGDTPAPAEGPSVTVAGTRVTGGEYFELALRVTAQKFQTVGAVLSYDKTQLEPVDWSGAAVTPVKAGENAGFWPTPPTVLHTRGPNGHAGKPALGCETEKRGYLYLGADTLAYGDLTDSQVVTVRFRYTEAVKTAVEGGQKLEDLITAPASAADYGKETTTIDFAPKGGYAVTESIPGAQLVLTTEDKVYEQNSAKNAVSCTAAFLLTEGAGLGSEGGISGDYAVTFFDWDGRVIDAITAPQNAEAAVADFEERAAVKAVLGKKAGYKFDRWVVVNQTINGLQMLNGSGETYFTSNDAPIPDSAKAAAKLTDLSPYVVDAASKGVLLQAAYVAKSTANDDTEDLVNNGSGDNLAKFYTTSAPTYSRYGSADPYTGSYSLKFDALRKNNAGGKDYGVTRLRSPAVIVTMTMKADGKNVVSLIELENTDEAAFEIVPTKAVDKVSYKVVDIYGVSNWPGCADKSDPNVSIERTVFVREGTRGFLAEQAEAVKGGASWDTTIDKQAFADAYLGVNTVKDKPDWWDATRIDAAKAALVVAAHGDGTLMTSGDVEAALNMVS